MSHPANGERVIITAKYLCEMFGHLPLNLFMGITGPFVAPTDDEALGEFYYRIREAEEIEMREGKSGKAVWIDLLNAFRKMSVFERERVRRDLPREAAKMILGQGLRD